MIPGPAYDHSRRPGHQPWRAGGRALLAAVDLNQGAGPSGGGFDYNWMFKSCRTKGLNPKRRKLENQAKRRHYRTRK